MTDRQRLALLRAAVRELKQTRKGYEPAAPHWRAAMSRLARLEDDLGPGPLPQLGPVWKGGKSVLQHDLTHATSRIPLYPAFDDAFVQGREIIAPEPLVVVAPYTSSNPGSAFYAQGASRIRYWFGHLDRSPKVGTRFVKGQTVGRVAPNSVGGGPHVHVGVNVELLFGKGVELEHHTDYTHGAPTVGAQLARLLT